MPLFLPPRLEFVFSVGSELNLGGGLLTCSPLLWHGDEELWRISPLASCLGLNGGPELDRDVVGESDAGRWCFSRAPAWAGRIDGAVRAHAGDGDSASGSSTVSDQEFVGGVGNEHS